MKVDFHIHTTYSDGTDTPSEIVRCAEKIGLGAIAITDHDTVEGVDAAIEEGKRFDIEVLPGVEISSGGESEDIHILGYLLDHKNRTLNKKLQEMKNQRSDRVPKMLAKLKEHGMEIPLELVKSIAGNGVISRQHIGEAMCKKGYISSKQEAFSKYIGRGRSCYVPRAKMLEGETISLIRSAGGIPVIAHPALIKDIENLAKYIVKLKEQGLMGVEIWYPYDKVQNRIRSDFPGKEKFFKWLQQIVQKENLLCTGGSDYEGKNKPVKLGEVSIPYTYVERLKVKSM